jgi:hypothetical protein
MPFLTERLMTKVVLCVRQLESIHSAFHAVHIVVNRTNPLGADFRASFEGEKRRGESHSDDVFCHGWQKLDMQSCFAWAPALDVLSKA